MSANVGFRVLPRRRKAGEALLASFAALPVANVSDCMNRLSGAGPALRPMHRVTGVMTGPALTVRTRPGDNLMIHKALLVAEPGDVLVIDGAGDLTNALVGELIIGYAIRKGVVGMVVNGAVRDLGWIRSHEFPVFAAGVTHQGPYRDGPGEINVPVAFGGMIVEPGDVVLGDDDGVVSVPLDLAEGVAAAARRKNETEARTMAETEAGRLDPKTWVDETLRRLGCEGV